MVLQYSPDGHLLYARLRDDDVSQTIEIDPDIYVDLDAAGRPLGIEFANADDFFPFLGRGTETSPTVVELPRDLEACLQQVLVARGFATEAATA